MILLRELIGKWQSNSFLQLKTKAPVGLYSRKDLFFEVLVCYLCISKSKILTRW